MKKNSKLHIAITFEEKEKLKRSADKIGISLASYCRLILISAKPKIDYL